VTAVFNAASQSSTQDAHLSYEHWAPTNGPGSIRVSSGVNAMALAVKVVAGRKDNIEV